MKQGYSTFKSEAWPKITILKQNTARVIEMYFLYLLTCGVFYVISLWVKSVSLWAYDEDEEGRHVLIEDEDTSFTIAEISKLQISADSISLTSTSSSITIDSFVHRYIRYFRRDEPFQEIQFDSKASGRTFHSFLSKQLNDQQVQERRKIFGNCIIDIKIPSIFILLKEGVFHPFFIFQIFSCVLWIFEEYYIYACAIFIMSMVSLIFNLVQTRETVLSVQKLAVYECKVWALRGSWLEVDSKELVPGDLIRISEGIIMPCDAVLIKGMCLVDESMLTGESLLVVKEEMQDSNMVYYHKNKKCTVSAGTLPKICRNEPVAVVVSTGFATAKGELVRSVLFPKPNRFSFYTDSFKFIGIMSIFGVIGLIWAVSFLVYHNSSTETIIIRGLDIITIVVPPVLPLVLTIGTSFSINRLKKLNISCISLPAVTSAGRVSVVVFDKTGTITEDWMSLKGVFTSTLSQASDCDYKVQENMAVCNSLSYIRGSIEGDPQEIAIFHSVAWEVIDSEYRWSAVGPSGQVNVLQVFHFSSESKRMGVIVQSATETCIHVKGAPEVIQSKCANIPEDFLKQVNHYTKEGFRVLACCYKPLDTFDPEQTLESFEHEMIYLGLLVLENPLKSNSSDTLRTLQMSDIKCAISTGDSHLTGVAVAKVCGLISAKVPLYIGEMQNGRLVWRDPTEQIAFLPKKCSIAITGDILEYMAKNLHPDLPAVVRSGVVFGRMFPQHKILLIELLQGADTMVAMVGDGANDCGALKTADVGLSLSKAEASIAAPFCTEDISGIVHILKEGRNALVTSLQSFKFVAMYSFIQYIAVSILYALENNLMDMQFLYQDLVIILPISISMANSGPYHTLAKVLPPGNLFSFSILGSLFGHLVINLVFQVSAFLLMLPFDWYESSDSTTDKPEACDDNTSIFVIACFQVLIAGLVFNIGPPYRRETLENFWFTASISFIMLMTIYLLMVPETVGDWFEVVELEPNFRWILAMLACGNMVFCYFHEKLFLPKLEDE